MTRPALHEGPGRADGSDERAGPDAHHPHDAPAWLDRPEPSDEDAATAWPRRPAVVELAAAILMIGGAVGLLGALSTALSASPAGEPFLWLTLLLSIGSIALGLLVRFGRLWLVAVNYAAVLGFLDLLGAGSSPLALMLGLADIAVVIILLVHKPWFDALRRRRLPD